VRWSYCSNRSAVAPDTTPIVQVPATTAGNTIAPTANGVLGLTVKQSTGTGSPHNFGYILDSFGNTIFTPHSNWREHLKCRGRQYSGHILSVFYVDGEEIIGPNGSRFGVQENEAIFSILNGGSFVLLCYCNGTGSDLRA
jgi:hypothetical protein